MFCSPDFGTVPGPSSPVRRPIRSTGEKAETALNGQEGEGGGKLLSGVFRSDRQTDIQTDNFPLPLAIYIALYICRRQSKKYPPPRNFLTRRQQGRVRLLSLLPQAVLPTITTYKRTYSDVRCYTTYISFVQYSLYVL